MKYVLIILFFIFNLPIFADRLEFSTEETAPYSTEDQTGFYDLLLKQLFQNLGYEIEILHNSPELSLKYANSGVVDGEFARISNLSLYENLIEIEEPLIYWKFVAITTKNNQLEILNWDDLKSYKVGYLRGWKIYEENVYGENVIQVNSIDSLFNMLLNKRVDIILYSELRAINYIIRNKIDGLEIIEKPLARRSMHLYMNVKHIDKVDIINNELVELKNSDFYKKLKKEVLHK